MKNIYAVVILVLSIVGVYLVLRKPTENGGVGEFFGTIYGNVILGPTCPVVKDPPDPACDDKPYATRLAVTTVDGARVIKEFSSAADGRFSVEVPPGTYSIRSAVAANVLPYCSTNEPLVVPVNDSIETTVFCDTGIR